MQWTEWLSLFIRWFHVIAGVAWIGASFYFVWLDNNLRTPPDWKKDKGIKGDLWAVHGGGFYEIGKYQYGPEVIPPTLHWFKWEAYTTWLSGFALLTLMYYFGASAYLIDPNVMPLEPATAVIMGLGFIFGGLALYELACHSPLAKSPWLFALFFMALLTLGSWLATSWFSGRGAYMHIGALIGTIMAGNVFFNIIPSQKKMVAAVENKQDIDPAWGAGAKLRSVHNNYLTLPLLFIMISNHYPMTYQHPQNWLVLILISVVSAWIRHFFNLRHQGIFRPSVLVTGMLGMLLIAGWISWPKSKALTDVTRVEQPETPLSESQKAVLNLVETHCTRCHSATPTDDIFVVAPMGLHLDKWAQIEQFAPRIYARTVQSKDMPLLNKTGMTEEERQVIADWYQSR
ncbi:urate hydroxylase PuuD [Neptunicella sp. SCSIO 80796]|uniref:urate hydroxylase PuuD n=1 Tax=Neptunicella plasticusilytica TaxID=3117012 RepID=UPI003A4E5102